MSDSATHWYTTLMQGGVWTAIGAAIAWLTGFAWKRTERADKIAEQKRAREDKMVEHTSGLALELLRIANGEVKMLKEQVATLSSQLGHMADLERRVSYFEEALHHIGQLLDPEHSLGKDAAETNARLFLSKMFILRQAKGMASNREQASRAAQSITDKGEDHAE